MFPHLNHTPGQERLHRGIDNVFTLDEMFSSVMEIMSHIQTLYKTKQSKLAEKLYRVTFLPAWITYLYFCPDAQSDALHSTFGHFNKYHNYSTSYMLETAREMRRSDAITEQEFIVCVQLVELGLSPHFFLRKGIQALINATSGELASEGSIG